MTTFSSTANSPSPATPLIIIIRPVCVRRRRLLILHQHLLLLYRHQHIDTCTVPRKLHQQFRTCHKPMPLPTFYAQQHRSCGRAGTGGRSRREFDTLLYHKPRRIFYFLFLLRCWADDIRSKSHSIFFPQRRLGLLRFFFSTTAKRGRSLSKQHSQCNKGLLVAFNTIWHAASYIESPSGNTFAINNNN